MRKTGNPGGRRVLLVHPRVPHENLFGKLAKSDLPPLGILYLASALIAAENQVRVIDLNLGDQEEGLFETVRNWRPDLIGLGTLAPCLDRVMETAQRIRREQGKPERQGLLGLLSVGFAAAAVLAALGFMLYALFSFRRRAVELGVLRASGLSTRHMAGFIAWELVFLLITGSAAGTGLGIWASNLFVPTLQVGAEMSARVPPFTVEIAWPAILQLYALYALIFIVALAALVHQLMRMKLFQAIKLGETL